MIEYPYLVINICSDKSIYKPNGYYFSGVELRTGIKDSQAELQSIEESMGLFNETVNLDIAPRLATICNAKDSEFAYIFAIEKFEQTLDILNISMNHISKYSLENFGCIRNMETNMVEPITPKMQSKLFQIPINPVPGYITRDYPYSCLDKAEILLNQFSNSNELYQRLERAAYWLRKARNEKNIQLRILFRWFSMEAAWKIDDSDNIIPKIMISLGFPIGQNSRILQNLDPKIYTDLTSHSDYKIWKKRVETRLDKIRILRNDSVHSGFRPWDIPRNQLLKLDHLSVLGSSRLINLMVKALMDDYTNLQDANDDLLIIWATKEYIIEDNHGTIIFSLNNPSFI